MCLLFGAFGPVVYSDSSLEYFFERTIVLGHGLIFQPVPAGLLYTQRYRYDNDTIKITDNFDMTNRLSIKVKTKKKQ